MPTREGQAPYAQVSAGGYDSDHTRAPAQHGGADLRRGGAAGREGSCCGCRGWHAVDIPVRVAHEALAEILGERVARGPTPLAFLNLPKPPPVFQPVPPIAGCEQ